MLAPYSPSLLPINNLDWKLLAPYLALAERSLATYNGLLLAIPNPNVLLSPLTSNEARVSSEIEGTQATLTDVLEYDADENTDLSQRKKDDIKEVLNYRMALIIGENSVSKGHKISASLIRSLHGILMRDVRGKDKNPGEFRTTQNYIGIPGRPVEEMTFIPPVPESVNPCITDLMDYINSIEDTPLVQLAVLHAQFEMIHPFNDGNGRLGRMLIPLFLYQKGILIKPVFYLSEYLNKYRDEYEQAFKYIENKNDWNSWVLFFLNAVKEQSHKNYEKAKKILELYEQNKSIFQEITKSRFSVSALDALFKRPIFTSTQFIHECGIPNRATSRNILERLIKANILKERRKSSGRRAAMYQFQELIDIVDA